MSLLDPVRKRIDVNCPAEHAFRVFAEQTATWWPLDRHSLGKEGARSCGFDPREGGDVFETDAAGNRTLWGRVVAWDPPRRLVFTWFVGREESTAQTVEVLFHEKAEGTEVELIHSGWENLGDQAADTREGYRTGWDLVFCELFAAACVNETRT